MVIVYMTANQFTALLEILKRIEEHLETIVNEQETIKRNMLNYYLVKPEDYQKAKELAWENKRMSSALLQRKMQISYTYAAMLMDMLEVNHVIAPRYGVEPSKVIASKK
jgi:DNA segregation ATPase FtsK/SpoIIIE, S-DNA-T family